MFGSSDLLVASILRRLSFGFMFLFLSSAALSQTTISGASFTLVATHSIGTQLFGLTADAQGKIYIGNNSNDTTGIPTQRFDPTFFSGTAIALANFGPSVGDADGITFGNGFLYVADRDEGIQRINVANGSTNLFAPGVAINGTGSPLAFRASDSHLFVGHGGLTNDNHIDEYNSSGGFVKTYATGTDVETMTYDPASGLIYYAPFGSSVRALDPVTGIDEFIGTVNGTIDGGLTFDPISGLLFVGTSNGSNPGRVETINPITGFASLFAYGFNGSTGLLRDPLTGDLYFLEADKLYRIDSSQVLPVPEPGSFAILLGMGYVSRMFLLRHRRK